VATGHYSLYQVDGTTPVATPQPSGSTWETIPRGTFANGRPRVALGKRVTWRYNAALTPAQYQQLVVARQAGRQTIETWKRPEGATAGQFVVATGIMAETVPGVLQGGEYLDVTVTFTDVRE
jgi:hypothetical protein